MGFLGQYLFSIKLMVVIFDQYGRQKCEKLNLPQRCSDIVSQSTNTVREAGRKAVLLMQCWRSNWFKMNALDWGFTKHVSRQLPIHINLDSCITSQSSFFILYLSLFCSWLSTKINKIKGLSLPDIPIRETWTYGHTLFFSAWKVQNTTIKCKLRPETAVHCC